MIVKTKHPIIVDNETSEFGGKWREKRALKKSQKSDRSFQEKTQEGLGKAQDGLYKAQGIVDTLGSIFGTNDFDRGADVSYTQPLPEQNRMSKGAKIGIAVGGVALVGLIIFAVVKSKSKKK